MDEQRPSSCDWILRHNSLTLYLCTFIEDWAFIVFLFFVAPVYRVCPREPHWTALGTLRVLPFL